LRVAVAESCTGGWISKVLTDPPGSSSWFANGQVVYSNESKVDNLGVPAQLLATAGAVSAEAVAAMAEGLLRQTAAELVIAVSGVAGPTGGTPDKPVGTVWIARKRGGRKCRCQCFHFSGNRGAVRRQTVLAALDAIADEAEAA
jgi:nicotinamide-nucleotide amidase